mgnify:CR=1 FL=1
MYAIIADGGRQYKVEEGQELEIDLRDVNAGDEITFDRVLTISSDEGVKVGQPVVEGALVTAEVIAENKAGLEAAQDKLVKVNNELNTLV